MNRILLVDDDLELTQLLTEILTLEGFQVTVAEDGEEGLQRLAEQSFDLVLLDVMMPKLNGFAMLTKLRKTHDTPVLMLTARGDSQDRVNGLEAGADDVVTEEDGTIEVYTTPNDFGTVLDGLEAAGFKAQSAEVTMIPSTEAELDAETAPKLMRLIDMLEDLDDVQEVYHNGSISDEVAATL